MVAALLTSWTHHYVLQIVSDIESIVKAVKSCLSYEHRRLAACHVGLVVLKKKWLWPTVCEQYCKYF
jgi:hypothetical protein